MPIPSKIDEDYLAYVRGHECAAEWFPLAGNCMSGGIEAHHIDGKGMGGSKRDDRKTVPLCRAHHQQYHDRGQIGEMSVSNTMATLNWTAFSLLLAYMDQGEPSKIFHAPPEGVF